MYNTKQCSHDILDLKTTRTLFNFIKKTKLSVVQSMTKKKIICKIDYKRPMTLNNFVIKKNI